MDPRIGTLNSGDFYAFANGYDQPEVRGTLAQVEAALGIREAAPAAAPATATADLFDVTMWFEFPAWDEVAGIAYAGIRAASKREAIAEARRQARTDGHAMSGRGKYWFTAKLGE